MQVFVKHEPDNTIPRIDAIWAAVNVDQGGEGLCAVQVGDMTTPLIATNPQRLEWVITNAQLLALVSGKTIRIVKFTQREAVEVFGLEEDGV